MTRRSRIAWAIAGLDVLVFLVTTLYPSDGGIAALILYLVGLASFAVVGAVLISRVPDNSIGFLLLGAGTVFVIALAIGTYSNAGLAQVPHWPLAEVARMLGDVLFAYPLVIAFIGVPLVFPDGRLASPRFRWVVVITIAGMAAWTLQGLLFDVDGLPRFPGSAVNAPLAAILPPVFLVSILIGLGGAVVAVARRYRHGGRTQREQVKWLAADVGLAAILVPSALLLAGVNPELANTLSGFAIITLFALPVAIGIAVLRYRLYEIDRLISRTIGWAVVTAVLVGVFVTLVVTLQTVFAQLADESSLAVAASTLVAFALFQPVRRRVQRAVDRRFDRARYDGDKTTQAFARLVREQVEIDTLARDLRAAVDGAMSPDGLALWLRTAQPSPIPPRS